MGIADELGARPSPCRHDVCLLKPNVPPRAGVKGSFSPPPPLPPENGAHEEPWCTTGDRFVSPALRTPPPPPLALQSPRVGGGHPDTLTPRLDTSSLRTVSDETALRRYHEVTDPPHPRQGALDPVGTQCRTTIQRTHARSTWHGDLRPDSRDTASHKTLLMQSGRG